MKKNILAIIPARGGSKGIPKKNLKILAGKPLIYYTIQAARESKYINSIVVSTDDEDIFHISESFDVEVIKRPENLSRDDSPTIDVIFHVLEQSKIRVHKPNIVVLLQPTSPLRTSSDIDAAIELFLQRDCDSVVSVVQNVHPPHWNLVLEEKYLKPLLGEQFFTKRRQELPETYLPNGAIFIAETKTLKMYRSFYCPKTIPFIMSIEKSVDIDSLFDLFIAEEIIKKEMKRIKTIKIENKKIGPGNPCFIIAEAGVNHNGDINLAKRLVDAASIAGADAIKFQTFHAENVVSSLAEKADYQKSTTSPDETQLEMLTKLELSDENFYEISDYAKNRGIIFLSTPFDEESVDLLHKLDVPAYKISSGEITNCPLLKKVAGKKKPIILSTGMSNLGEVEEALNYLKKYGAEEIVLLHCTTSYPAPPTSVNLRAMKTLNYAFQVPVGYSDHTEGIAIPIAAAAMGACVIEKHFTLDRNLPGPDHQASIEPADLKAMVNAIRIVEKAFGDGAKYPTAEEEAIKKIVRRSIVASGDIHVGDRLNINNLAIKRPGTGIEPKFLNKILSMRAKTTIYNDQIISWDFVE